MPKRKRTRCARAPETTTGTADSTTGKSFGTTAADDRETSERALTDILPALHALADIESTKSQLHIYGLLPHPSFTYALIKTISFYLAFFIEIPQCLLLDVDPYYCRGAIRRQLANLVRTALTCSCVNAFVAVIHLDEAYLLRQYFVNLGLPECV